MSPCEVDSECIFSLRNALVSCPLLSGLFAISGSFSFNVILYTVDLLNVFGVLLEIYVSTPIQCHPVYS